MKKETPKKENGSIVKDYYRKLYGKGNSCGDELAAALKAATTGEDGKTDANKLVKVGNRNGIDVPTRWGHLNVGQIRMNLGNVLRAMANRGESIEIPDVVVNNPVNHCSLTIDINEKGRQKALKNSGSKAAIAHYEGWLEANGKDDSKASRIEFNNQ